MPAVVLYQYMYMTGHTSLVRPNCKERRASPTFAEAHVDSFVGYVVDVKHHMHGTARLGGVVVVEL